MAVKRRAEAYWLEAAKRWQINVQRNGLRKTFNSSLPGMKGKHECEAKADKWLERFATDQKLDAAIALFLEHKKETISLPSYKNACSRFNTICKYISTSKRLSAITIHDWQKVLDGVAKSGKADTYVVQIRGAIHDLVVFCRKNRWDIERLEEGDLTMPKCLKGAKDRKALDTGEIKQILSDAFDDIWHINLFRFLLLTGFRKNEAAAIMWEDIDFNREVLMVKRGLNRMNEITTGKTKNVLREVALTKYAISILNQQREKLKTAGIISPWVFPDRKGSIVKYTDLSSVWDREIKTRGINHTAHELRHTFISYADSNLPLALLKKSVGHSASMNTQKQYSHTTDKDLDAMRTGIEKAFSDIL